jgi:hypothetical protein
MHQVLITRLIKAFDSRMRFYLPQQTSAEDNLMTDKNI